VTFRAYAFPAGVALCTLTCTLMSARPAAPLRGYRVLVEGRDTLSDYLARALKKRGFTVRRRVRGGGPPTAALVTFSYREVGPEGVTWCRALLADTRSGVVVANVIAPMESLGVSTEARAASLADSIALQLAPRNSPP